MNRTLHCTSRAIFDTRKLNRAINRLVTLCSDSGEQIIEQLSEYPDLPFIDLLIKTGLDQEALQQQLDRMVASGVLKRQTTYYQAEYCLNTTKLSRIASLAASLQS